MQNPFRRKPYAPFTLPERYDWTIRKLWCWGWDTARIADFINDQRPTADERVREEDVYNVLDRALGRPQRAIVKTP